MLRLHTSHIRQHALRCFRYYLKSILCKIETSPVRCLFLRITVVGNATIMDGFPKINSFTLEEHDRTCEAYAFDVYMPDVGKHTLA